MFYPDLFGPIDTFVPHFNPTAQQHRKKKGERDQGSFNKMQPQNVALSPYNNTMTNQK